MLTQSWIQFDHKYGVTIDDLIGNDDPSSFIRSLREVGEALQDTTPIPVAVVGETLKTNSESLFKTIIGALISGPSRSTKTISRVLVAGFNGFNFLPNNCTDHCRPVEVHHNTDYKTVFESAKLFSYIAGQATIPIIIDTGASISLTPVVTDFVGAIEPADLDSLQGLSSKTKVCGQGTVHWKIQDMFGMVRTIAIKAYYVPEASIRLMSPQQYFQEHKSGHAEFDGEEMAIHLPSDKGVMKFPFHKGNNLPFMLLNDHPSILPISANDINLLSNSSRILTSVAEQTNQNLTIAQKELLLWHWKLAHANFNWIQSLFSVPRDGGSPTLRSSHKLTGETVNKSLKCAACELSKASKQSSNTQRRKDKRVPNILRIRKEDLNPGQRVSIDQYQSRTPGRRLGTKGSEKKKFCGGTLFYDHGTQYISINHQVSLNAGETVQSKDIFEQEMANFGRKVKAYHTDNAPFQSKTFRESLISDNQPITFSGVGAHHQNGAAERAIKTITWWARTMMLHAIIMWPEHANTELWPMAMDQAVYIWNHLPRQDSRLSPMELLSGRLVDNHEHLQRLHVFGAPCFVLDPKLQDGKSLPKWRRRARQGQYLGVSKEHASNVANILNLNTGNISPQFHVVHDDLFTTVSNAGAMNLDDEGFDEGQWRKLVSSGHEKYLDEEDSDTAKGSSSQPHLHDEWLTKKEIINRETERKKQWFSQKEKQHIKIKLKADIERDEQPQEDQEKEPELEQVSDDESTNSVLSLIDEGLIDDDIEDSTPKVLRRSARKRVPIKRLMDEQSLYQEAIGPRRSGNCLKSSKQIIQEGHKQRVNVGYYERTNSNSSVSKTKKARVAHHNAMSLNVLKWENTVHSMKQSSSGISKFVEVNYKDETIEEMRPDCLNAKFKKSDPDLPTFSQAMNGDESEEYWEACQKEYDTLENKMDAWDVVNKDDSMHVLPGTWAIRKKRRPDGSVSKYKSRFCVRGDNN